MEAARKISKTVKAGLSQRMRQALKELRRDEGSLLPDTVHDLRVALRRVFSLVSALGSVSKNSGFRKIRKEARPLFKRLGRLRDIHVSIRQLGNFIPNRQPLRDKILSGFIEGRNREERECLKLMRRFRRKKWKKIARRFSRPDTLTGLDVTHFHIILQKRLDKMIERHERALQKSSAKNFHKLRIAVKRFRYSAENFIPAAFEHTEGNLQHIQDLLGEAQDLCMFEAKLAKFAARSKMEIPSELFRRIEIEREKKWIEYQEFVERKNLMPLLRSAVYSAKSF